MISEDLPAIIFTSMIIVLFIIMLFYILQDYVVKSGDIYLYRTATSIISNEVYGKDYIEINEYESKVIHQKVMNYKFSTSIPENYNELIIVSLPALTDNSTNYSEVSIYAYK